MIKITLAELAKLGYDTEINYNSCDRCIFDRDIVSSDACLLHHNAASCQCSGFIVLDPKGIGIRPMLSFINMKRAHG